MFIFQIWALVHFNQSFEPSNYFGKTLKTLLIVIRVNDRLGAIFA